MDESDTRKLEINDLFELMVKCTKELVALSNSANTDAFDEKKREVELLQRIIVTKN